jgi:hypothetical protein
MPLSYDRYGFTESNVDEIVRGIEESLGITLTESESSYVGVHWSGRGFSDDEHFDLESNFLTPEGDWTAPDHKECCYLLEVAGTTRSAELELLLTSKFEEKIRLLRRELV